MTTKKCSRCGRPTTGQNACDYAAAEAAAEAPPKWADVPASERAAIASRFEAAVDDCATHYWRNEGI